MSDTDLGHASSTGDADPPGENSGTVCYAGPSAMRLARTVVRLSHADPAQVLLVLAKRGRIDKLGPGQYQARRGAA
jgi:hypothetical protein